MPEVEKSQIKVEQEARKRLEAWIKNHNLWCHDPKQSGWQNVTKK